MRTFRGAIASCLTSVTKRKATDLTFAVAIRGNDVGPETVVVGRRAAAMRRAIAKDKETKVMMDEIIVAYGKRKNPGCYVDEEALRKKVRLQENRRAQRRARMRREGKPQGPVG